MCVYKETSLKKSLGAALKLSKRRNEELRRIQLSSLDGLCLRRAGACTLQCLPHKPAGTP